MKRFLLAFLFGLIGLWSLDLDMEKAVSTALERNKALREKAKLSDALKHDLRNTWGFDFNDTSASASWAFPKDEELEQYYSLNLWYVTYDLAKGTVDRARAYHSYKSSLIDRIALKQRVVMDVRIVYQKVLLIKQRMSFLDDIYEISLKKYSSDNEKLKRGLILPVDKMESELRMLSDDLTRNSVKADYVKAQLELKKIMGVDLEEELTLAPYEAEMEIDLKKSMARMLESHADLARNERNRKLQRSISRANFYRLIPEVANSGTYNISDPRFTVTLQLGLPLMDLFTIGARAAKNHAMVEKIQIERQKITENLKFLLMSAWEDYKVSIEQKKISEKTFMISRERLKLLEIRKEHVAVDWNEYQAAVNQLHNNEKRFYESHLAMIRQLEYFLSLSEYR